VRRGSPNEQSAQFYRAVAAALAMAVVVIVTAPFGIRASFARHNDPATEF